MSGTRAGSEGRPSREGGRGCAAASRALIIARPMNAAARTVP